MTSRTISEAFHISAAHTQEILRDPHIHMGFEAEMILPESEYGGNEIVANREFNRDLNKMLGSVSSSWELHYDGSIKPDAHAPGWGTELVSTPAQINKSLHYMQQTFALMSEKAILTNHTTGLHVGVSIQNQLMSEVNKLKLLMLLDEAFVSDAFDRTFNSYTQSHVELLKKQIQKAQQTQRNWIQSRVMQDLIQEINKRIDLKKHRTVNFSKLSQGYLEFRIMGNEDYHKNFDMVRYFVIRYAAVLKAALDPEAFEAEYKAQVSRLVAQALAQAKPEFTDLTHKYAVLGAGSPSEKYENYYQRFQQSIKDQNAKASVVLLSMLIRAADAHADVTHNARLINAAALAYRLMLQKQLHMTISEFRDRMKQYAVPPDQITRVIRYLRTY